MRILIAGCGYTGIRLAKLLAEAGHTVFGIRRNPPPPQPFLTWITGDLASTPLPDNLDAAVLAAGLRRDTPEHYHRLFVDGYRRLLDRLATSQPAPQRCLLVSTTGVFAEQQGAMVDELSPVSGDGETARYYLAAELAAQQAGLPSVTVARLSGIYGPDRIRLIRETAEGRARLHPPPPHYLNHLHADDAAAALAHLLQLPAPDSLYVVSDEEPADRNTVIEWLAGAMGMPHPPFAGDDTARPARRSGNKRCSPARLIASGYRFRYPTFREGYRALLTTKDHALHPSGNDHPGNVATKASFTAKTSGTRFATPNEVGSAPFKT